MKAVHIVTPRYEFIGRLMGTYDPTATHFTLRDPAETSVVKSPDGPIRLIKTLKNDDDYRDTSELTIINGPGVVVFQLNEHGPMYAE